RATAVTSIPSRAEESISCNARCFMSRCRYTTRLGAAARAMLGSSRGVNPAAPAPASTVRRLMFVVFSGMVRAMASTPCWWRHRRVAPCVDVGFDHRALRRRELAVEQRHDALEVGAQARDALLGAVEIFVLGAHLQRFGLVSHRVRAERQGAALQFVGSLPDDARVTRRHRRAELVEVLGDARQEEADQSWRALDGHVQLYDRRSSVLPLG